MKKTATDIKDVIVVAAFAYTAVQATRGWYGLAKEATLVAKDRRKNKH